MVDLNEFDTVKNYIFFILDTEGNGDKYVKVVLDKSELTEDFDSYDYMDEFGADLWYAKYRETIPATAEPYNACSLSAGYCSYDGNTHLTAEELAAVLRISGRYDLTMDLLWFVVENLGWRPGRLVAPSDCGWTALKERFAKDDPEGTERIVRYLLEEPLI